ncbi:MAG: (2E,6E)-farnesyl diphosphate synthase [Gammaproteobacteria bacterium]|nr:(2E,6E)-farnesyl diphosphate synthase [Gammaproteobacteria bacterium]
MARCQARLETSLSHWLPPAETHPAALHAAMRYAVLGGGKRIRPTLVYASGQAVGSDWEQLDAPACAVEFIHAYSLVHDDLPAMDDDDLRRGKPSCHKAFGEAEAILAGDALQTLGFYVLTHDKSACDSVTRLRMIEAIALAAGSRGMVGGQMIDLAAAGRQLDIAELEDMHIHKTGALIRASVVLGALTRPGLAAETLERLDHYAKCIGLAFQIRDDILDVEGETDILGKRSGADLSLHKSTYAALIGLDDAKQRAKELHEEAMDSLSGLDGKADPLRWISLYIIERDR